MLIEDLTPKQREEFQGEIDCYAGNLCVAYLDKIDRGKRDIATGYIASIGFTLVQHKEYLTKEQIRSQMRLATLAAKRFGEQACEFLRQEDHIYRCGGDFGCENDEEFRRAMDNVTSTNMSLEKIAKVLLATAHFWSGVSGGGYIPPADTRFRHFGESDAKSEARRKLWEQDLAEGALYDLGFADELREMQAAGRG